MNTYELTFILPASFSAAKQKQVRDKVEKIIADLGGKIGEEKEWGEKEFGVYFFYEASLEPDKVRELGLALEIDEDVLRYLLVRKKVK